ncbi:MAG TPA: CHAD domain-containing protein, partial [Candidatus Nitrosocosmicus sp.]|nr:CHAD domain-containing protein [Candidatus Nitrosocosmicus sp.]
MLEYDHIHFDLETYIHNCSRNINRICERLDNYLENPTKESIHDMRTSLRRLEATYKSNAKQIREKKKFKSFAETGRELFKINSKIRDTDIIIEKLSKEGNMSEQDLEYFASHLIKDRERRLEEARTIALDLKNIVVPDIYSHKKEIGNKSIKRVSKLVMKLKTNLDTKLPAVLNDDSKIDELHEVRKDAKKLRYLFELLLNKEDEGPEKGIDKDNRSRHKILSRLEKIQKLLGDIHDYDITIDYLNQHPSDGSSVPKILTNLRKIRKRKYNEFVEYTKPIDTIGILQS